MTAFATANFNGTSGTLLENLTNPDSTTWTKVPTGQTGSMAIGSGTYANEAIQSAGGGDVAYACTGVPPSADYDVTATVVFQSNSGNFGVCGRIQSGSQWNMYFLVYNGGVWTVYKRVNAAGTAIAGATTTSQSLTVGTSYTMKLSMRGSTISGYVNGTLVSTGTDTAFTAAGSAGISMYQQLGTNLAFTSFSASPPVVSVATSYTVTAASSSGAVGVASQPISVVPNGSLANALVVTPSDSVAGGTFSPTSLTFASGSAIDAAQPFTYTPASAGTATISFTHSGQTGITDPASITYSAANILSINNASIFLPANWISGSGFIDANVPGAYIKFGFSGTSCQLQIDTSTNPTELPKLFYVIDGSGPQYITVSTAAAGTVINLTPTALASGNHQIQVGIAGLGAVDRWNTPSDHLRITGILLDAGATISAAVTLPKKLLIYGDSITEGASTLGSANTVAMKQWWTTWINNVGRILQAEITTAAFQAQGYEVTGQGNVPNFNTMWNLLRSGVSRTFPAFDYILINHGHNGTTVQADVTTMVANLRGVCPNALIFLVTSFNGTAESVNAAAFAAISDSKVFLIDCAAEGQAIIGLSGNTTDGTHPTPGADGMLGVLVAAQINAKLPPTRSYNFF